MMELHEDFTRTTRVLAAFRDLAGLLQLLRRMLRETLRTILTSRVQS